MQNKNQKLIIGNWKQNPETLTEGKELVNVSIKFSKNSKIEIVHAVPSIFLAPLVLEFPEENFSLQNISTHTGGSFTGELSGIQAKHMGAKYCIVGHSETRLSPENPKGDEDKEVNAKIQNCLKAEVIPCVCIGEYERDENFKTFLENQLLACFQNINEEDFKKIVVAYEPVWAIGKNAKRAATKNEIEDTINHLKKILKKLYPNSESKVLYGGSVDEKNAEEIIQINCVDGLLVGRASSQKEKWNNLLTVLVNTNMKSTYINENWDFIKEGSRVLLRLDLNVPTDESGQVVNDFRIRESLPLIEKLLARKAKVIVLAHKEKGSLEKVVEYTKKYFPNLSFAKVFSENGVSNEELDKVSNIKNGEIVFLENIRLDEREKSKDTVKRDELGEMLSKLGDVYINEAFSASHRDHASVTSIPKFLPSFLGISFQKEVTELNKALNPEKPMLLIVGGAKFDTKLPMIEKFLNVSDKIFIGGALAHSFWKKKGFELGKSLIDDEVELSEKVTTSEKIILPIDVVVENGETKKPENILKEERIVDFGKETLIDLVKQVSESKTIVWNGPLGYYEEGFDLGTKSLFAEISKMDNKISILGGGDTVTEIDKTIKEGTNLNFTHVSSGGGAMIEFLSNGTLPGIEVVSRKK
jgi:phosphoglycerate kinase